MAENERVRLEIAFEGNQVLTVYVPSAIAVSMSGAHDSLSFEAEDGRYTISVTKVVFVKRFARESRVGFGADG